MNKTPDWCSKKEWFSCCIWTLFPEEKRLQALIYTNQIRLGCNVPDIKEGSEKTSAIQLGSLCLAKRAKMATLRISFVLSKGRWRSFQLHPVSPWLIATDKGWCCQFDSYAVNGCGSLFRNQHPLICHQTNTSLTLIQAGLGEGTLQHPCCIWELLEGNGHRGSINCVSEGGKKLPFFGANGKALWSFFGGNSQTNFWTGTGYSQPMPMRKMVDNWVVFFWVYRSLCTGSMPTRMPVHAYAEWKGCLRWSSSRLGAYTGALRGVLCWMVMHLVNDGGSAYATLPTQQKAAKYQVNSLRSFIRTSLEYMTLVIQ